MLIHLFNTCFAGRIDIANITSLFNGIQNFTIGIPSRFYKWVNFTYNQYWILIIIFDWKYTKYYVNYRITIEARMSGFSLLL